MEAVHCCQHLLLGVEGVQVPLGPGVSTVLSQTWGWALVAGLKGLFFGLFLSFSVTLGESMLGKASVLLDISMPELF